MIAAARPRFGCPQCEELRAELAAAQDELAEWRRQEREQAAEGASAERLWRARRLGLTPGEAKLLLCLLAHPGERVARERMIAACVKHEEAGDKTLDVVVSGLRRKLRKAGHELELELLWGAGRRLSRACAGRLEAAIGAAP